MLDRIKIKIVNLKKMSYPGLVFCYWSNLKLSQFNLFFFCLSKTQHSVGSKPKPNYVMLN